MDAGGTVSDLWARNTSGPAVGWLVIYEPLWWLTTFRWQSTGLAVLAGLHSRWSLQATLLYAKAGGSTSG
jgi:hypothetical protein